MDLDYHTLPWMTLNIILYQLIVLLALYTADVAKLNPHESVYLMNLSLSK